jgi:transcriptional regulator with XRE-family HTH domain
MNEHTPTSHAELAAKIARLVEEKGWNQEDFAKIAGLNRQTIRQILQPAGDRRLRNATIARCARALNLTVHDLRTVPVERLLQRLRQPPVQVNGDAKLHRLNEQATEPALRAWIERNQDRTRQLTEDEVEELLAMQGEGGALAALGVEGVVSQMERRRNLLQQVQWIASTEYLGLLEQLVGLIYDKVRPDHRHPA